MRSLIQTCGKKASDFSQLYSKFILNNYMHGKNFKKAHTKKILRAESLDISLLFRTEDA